MEIHRGVDTPRCVPRIERLPCAPEDGRVDAAAAAVAGGVPALDAAAVDVGAEGEGGVAREADAEAVGVAGGVGGGEGGGG